MRCRCRRKTHHGGTEGTKGKLPGKGVGVKKFTVMKRGERCAVLNFDCGMHEEVAVAYSEAMARRIADFLNAEHEASLAAVEKGFPRGDQVG